MTPDGLGVAPFQSNYHTALQLVAYMAIALLGTSSPAHSSVCSLMRTYYVPDIIPDTIPGTGDRAMKKADIVPALGGLCSLTWEGDKAP